MTESPLNLEIHSSSKKLFNSRLMLSKSTPVRELLSNHLVYYPTPANLNYF